MTISEGFRLAPDHENRDAPSTTDRLDFIFADADKKCEAVGFKEPTTESIVEFCDDVKQERTKEAATVQ